MIWVYIAIYLLIGVVIAIPLMIDKYSKTIYWGYGIFLTFLWLPVLVVVLSILVSKKYHGKTRRYKM